MKNQDDELWKELFAVRFKELCGDTPYRELSVKLGIGASTVSAYINGDRVPKIKALNSIANVFGVSPMWLMGADVPKYEYKKTPDIAAEGLSEDRRYLIDRIMSLSEEEVRGLRAIVDLVLAQRDK